nr:DUF4143 domain-containing protein [Elusimicrobiota bacterium]
LNANQEKNIFKKDMLDVGVLGAMLDLSPKIIIEGDKLFSWYNGVFTENYVAQQVITSGIKKLYYWTSGHQAEIDFIMQTDEYIYPLEVKSGTNLKAKSLKVYKGKYNPKYLCRTSMLNFSKSKMYCDFPLYAISLFPELLL